MFRVLPIVAALLAAATHVHGQQSLTPARGTTSIITGRFDAVSIDVTESALSFLNVQGELGSPTGNERTTNTRFTISAQKFKRDIISRGNFTPGFEFEHRFTIAQHLLGRPQGTGQAPGAESVRAIPSGFRIFYMGFRADATGLQTAVVDSTGAAIKLERRTSGTVAFNGGINVARSAASNVFGLGFEVRRAFSTPLAAQPRNVCVQTPIGVDGSGKAVIASDCADRFTGELADQWLGHVRTDVVTRRIQLAPGDDASATIGLIGAASANLSERAKSTYNFALGPAIYRGGSPYQVTAAALFEIVDATNASGQFEDFEDRVFLRLYLGVPFTR